MIIGPETSLPPGEREVDLSVVIVSYNVAYFLELALLSVRRAAEGLRVEVWVVDNASRDESVAVVRARFPDVHLIANVDNVGFSRANNQALRLARGRHSLLLNPDTVVGEDTFRACLTFMDQHPRCGGLGVRMLDGHGRFLPESKRGLPTPWVAFSKIFGLSALFPRSRRFAGYHLGYLPDDETHEIDILSGAFMWLRKEATDQVGLLDEDYFMYGEDVDLSYRLQLGGWQNYYFPGTQIIHYKGESTKRTTVNYVRVFYRAMAIFARKHFSAQYAAVFGRFIDAAIWLRAGAAVARRLATAALPTLLDAGLIFGGMVFLKDYWEVNHKFVRTAYPPQFLGVAVPAYIAVWLLSTYLSGGYDEPTRAGRIVRGVALGTVLISAISNFLDNWRFSKALIVLGGAWAVAVLVGRRLLFNLARYGELRLGERRAKRVAVVGLAAEAARVRHLLSTARVAADVIGTIEPMEVPVSEVAASVDSASRQELQDAKLETRNTKHETQATSLGTLADLNSLVALYQLDEIIFCGRDLLPSQIISAMARGAARPVEYKILPENSAYIIGSSSKDSPGDYYELIPTPQLFKPAQRRAQRLFNVASAATLLLAAPLLIWFITRKGSFLRNCLAVLAGRRSWVGWRYTEAPTGVRPIPAVLSPADRPAISTTLDQPTRQRLEALYANDYSPAEDLEILLRRFRDLGNSTPIPQLATKQSL